LPAISGFGTFSVFTLCAPVHGLPVSLGVMSNKIYCTIGIIFISILVPLMIAAQDITDWRTQSHAEMKSNELDWRKKDPNLFLKVTADFDGDGIEDTATILINDKENKMGLFAALSSQPGKRIKLVEFDSKSWSEVMGIAVAEPGTYKTACGKGFWDCKADESAVLKLHRPAINLFKIESANSFFIWNPKTKNFNRIWISD
jgi:hypothetical protein